VSDLCPSSEQLLDLDGIVRGDSGLDVSAGPGGPAVEVLVVETVDVVVVTESEDAFDVSTGFSGSMKCVLAPAD
jgi:hypothetical protein